MMKKVIFAVAAIMFVAGTMSAQTQQPVTTSQQIAVATSANLDAPAIQIPLLKNSVYAGWGFWPVDEMLGMVILPVFQAGFAALQGYTIDSPNNHFSLSAYFVGYERYLTKWLALGLDYTYTGDHMAFKPKEGSTQTRNMIVKTTYHTVMLNAKAVWWSTPSFRLYSRVALGVSVIGLGDARYTDDNSRVNEATPFFPYGGAQLSAIGIEFGRNLAVFVEPLLTAGWQGTMITAGVKFNF